jgi:hypothetical protein
MVLFVEYFQEAPFERVLLLGASSPLAALCVCIVGAPAGATLTIRPESH